jgi:hypothetical protein
MLHIVNGDILGERIKHIPGEVLVWREMYDYGPTNLKMDESLMLERASFFNERIDLPIDLYLNNSKAQEDRLNSINKNTDITLWFEHDRYDQTMLVFLLSQLIEKEFKTLSMVSINRHSSIANFHSLSQLDDTALTELYAKKETVTIDQLREGKEVWKLYASNNPESLLKWVNDENPSFLPFLKKAMRVHFEYFPHFEDGLSTIERQTLEVIERKEMRFTELFNILKNNRTIDGLSNMHFSAILNNLRPLIRCGGDLPTLRKEADPLIAITEAGLSVIHQKAHRFSYTGSSYNWWLGGVQLKEKGWLLREGKLIKVNLINFT